MSTNDVGALLGKETLLQKTVFLGTSDLLEIVNDRDSVGADSEGDTHTHTHSTYT